jgi:hypothetical protein
MMSSSIIVVLDESYIMDFGDEVTDTFGNPVSSIGNTEFIEEVHSAVFETRIIGEFQSGWRDKVRIEVDEVVAADFVEYCANSYINGERDLELVVRLIYPLILPALRDYKYEHARAMKKKAPSEIRREYSDSLIPLYDAIDGFFTISEIIRMVLEGFISSVNPLKSRFARSEEISSKLNDSILENRDEINLDNEYFYQGPEHLGILQSGKRSSITSCVHIRGESSLIPVCPADEDIINTHTMSIVREVISRGDY